MLPSVFLSLEGTDAVFVKRVHELLPDGLAYFYPRSFQNGENLVAAMEDRVGKATMFVLFASKRALASPWVGFEIDQARIAKLKNTKLRILVFPTDPSVGVRDMPRWMQDFWIGKAGYGAREIARYIRRSLINGPLSRMPGAQVYGRGSLVDAAIAMVQEAVLRTEAIPNVFVLAGNGGIGRRTFKRKFLVDAFPATPELEFGPDFQLPQFADLTDLYRALRQEIEDIFSLEEFTKSIGTFEEMDQMDQVREVTANLAHFGELGQAVTMVTGNGIFEDRGFLKPWVAALFRQISSDRRVKLVIVSNRMLHENELRAHANLMQMSVPPLKEVDIRSLMIATCVLLTAKPELPGGDVIRSIGGHPGIAKATASLVAKRGPAVIDNDYRDLFRLQEDVLGESLNFEHLGELEKDVLSVLSWVPHFEGEMLRHVVMTRHNVTGEQFADAVSGLILSCIIEVSGANYIITSPVRALFRRLHGYGSPELRKLLSAKLKEAWERSRSNEQMRLELIDAIVFMTAIEGGTLPPEFKDLLLPSTLQEVVRDTYDQGHDDDNALNRVANWGLPAKSMRMDETTREEILSYVVRAQTRLGDSKGAEETLKFFDERSYRSRFYLRSFFMRHHHDDIEQAIELLRKARDVRKYTGRVIADLALCYQRLGRWSELKQLVREEERHIGRNPALLDVRIGMLVAENDYSAAEVAIRTLEVLPRQGARAECRKAMIMMKRDQNFKGAQALLTSSLEKGSGGQERVRRLRGNAAASAGDFHTAKVDAEFLRARKRGYVAHDIEARIRLTQRDFDGAEAELNKARKLNLADELLRARIYDMKAIDIRTPIAERDRLLLRAAEIRALGRSVDEFDIES